MDLRQQPDGLVFVHDQVDSCIEVREEEPGQADPPAKLSFARAGRTWRVAPDYDVDDAASIVVNAILGYTDYINRTVWRK